MATWMRDGDFGVILGHTTERTEGDFAVDAEPVGLAERRLRVAPHRWVWLRQVHGADVKVVTAENAAEVTGSEGDAVVTAEPELVLAVQTADCAPITLTSGAGVIGLVHAGWRGIEAGVIERAFEAMDALGSPPDSVHLGPFIRGSCYEFGADDLDRLARRFGDRIRTVTDTGSGALDLAEMIRSAEHRPHRPWPGHGDCTACRPDRWFSHRARGERERMATVVWREGSYRRAMVHR
jgi:polyphenol oxidase